MTPTQQDFDFRGFCRLWATDRDAIARTGRLVPSPSGFFMALIVGRANIDAFAGRLGLATMELCRQLDEDRVSEEHWPAILKAVHEAAQRISLLERMERHSIRFAEREAEPS